VNARQKVMSEVRKSQRATLYINYLEKGVHNSYVNARNSIC